MRREERGECRDETVNANSFAFLLECAWKAERERICKLIRELAERQSATTHWGRSQRNFAKKLLSKLEINQ